MYKKFTNKFIKNKNLFFKSYTVASTTNPQNESGWKYKIKDGALVFEMNTNRVNSMGSKFLKDMNQFLEIRELPEHRELPVVLIASGTNYSAGLDLFELFDREKEDSKKFVRQHLKDLGETIVKFWQLPVPTITACNGNAIAGGAILLLCGDYRLGVRKKYVIGVNELNVGIPFPLWAFEIIKHNLGEYARLASLTSDLYSPEQALKLGFLHELAEPELMVQVATERAKKFHRHNLGAYAKSKQLFFLSVNDRLKNHSESVMDGVIENIYSDRGWEYIQSFIQKLKSKKNY